MAITWSGTSWAQSTAYALRARVVNGGNVYQCTVAGTSAASPATGPSGTGSAITDGTVTWAYLGANTGSVIDADASLSDVTAAAQAMFLSLAETLVVDTTIWGDLLDYGRLYLSAHFGQLWALRGHGPITSETVGPLSTGYGSLVGPFAIDLTSAGRQYMDLVRTTEAVLGLTA